MEINLLSPPVDIMAQTEGGQFGPATFIALFHVPAKDACKLLDAWYGEEAFVLRQPASSRGSFCAAALVATCFWTSQSGSPLHTTRGH
jgi:hypothetical protein